MYEAFYGLTDKPFNLTPDPHFLYLSAKHKEAFAHLLFGIKHHTGFVMVTGEIGTGKTTICRSLVSQLEEDTEIAFIFNPCLSPEELLRNVNQDFGIDSRGQTRKDLVDELNEYLLEKTGEGKSCVLVIDEAQNLTPQVLEQIRLLSNIETETQKLLQIVLIGQPELAQHLVLPELRQLNQRITARYHLKPLDLRETLQYIAYRLRVAGGRKKVRFTRAALRAVYRLSGGTPRVINAICDRALLIGYTLETRDITKAVIRRAAKEVRGLHVYRRHGQVLRRYLPSPTLLAAAVLIVLAGKYLVAPLASGPLIEVRTNSGSLPSISQAATARTASELAAAAASMYEPTAHSAVAGPTSRPRKSGILEFLDPVVARNAAALTILRAWNTALVSGYPEDDSVESLIKFAQANGLACEALSLTLDQVLTINLPAFAKIATETRFLWIGIIGMEEGRFRVCTGIGEAALVDREELEPRYMSQAVILWRDPAPGAPVLRANVKGRAVLELQQQLSALRGLPLKLSGVYGADTVAAIKQVQEEAGLTIDGVMGKQTRMLLCSWLPQFYTPTLVPKPNLTLESSPDTSETPGQTTEVERAEAPKPLEPAPAAILDGGASPPPLGPSKGAPAPSPEAATEVEPTPALSDGGGTTSEQLPDDMMSSPVRVDDLGAPTSNEGSLVAHETDSEKAVTAPSTGALPLVPRKTEPTAEVPAQSSEAEGKS
jgi:general secretion pathway protein A